MRPLAQRRWLVLAGFGFGLSWAALALQCKVTPRDAQGRSTKAARR